MTLLPEVRQELYETAARRAAAPRRRWWPAAVRTLPVAAAVAVTLVVLVALLALKPGHVHPSHQQPAVSQGTPPPVPTPLPPSLSHYLDRAGKALKSEDRACDGPVSYRSIAPRAASIRSGLPPRSMLSAFSVLARPATKDDRRMMALMKRHGRDRLAGYGGVYLSDIREAQYHYGGGYFLVPVADANGERTPVRCDREELMAVARAVAHATRAIRGRVLRHTAALIAYQRYNQEHPEGICLAHLNDRGFGGGGCGETANDLEQGIGGGITGGEGDKEGGSIEAGIIPDGVATVTVQYPARRSHAGRRFRGFTTTAPVVNNVVVVNVPPGVDDAHRTVTWRAASGAVIPHAP